MYMWRERSKEEKHEDVVNTGLLQLDVVEGFKIRPGFFRMYGACVASNGVRFTVQLSAMSIMSAYQVALIRNHGQCLTVSALVTLARKVS